MGGGHRLIGHCPVDCSLFSRLEKLGCRGGKDERVEARVPQGVWDGETQA